MAAAVAVRRQGTLDNFSGFWSEYNGPANPEKVEEIIEMKYFLKRAEEGHYFMRMPVPGSGLLASEREGYGAQPLT